MTAIVRVLAAVALAALAACAARPVGAPKTLQQKLADNGYKLGDKVDRILSWHVDGWSRIDDEHVVFNAGPSRDYLVTLGMPCDGLASASVIGFTSTVEQVSTFDKLVVRQSGFTSQCPIDELHELKRVKQKG